MMGIRAGLVATCLVGVTGAMSPAPAPVVATSTTTYTATTQNVRVTLGKTRAAHDIRRALDGSDLLLTQEMGGRHATRFAPAGIGVMQPPDRAARELAIYYRRSQLEAVGSFPILFHASRLFRSATRYALVAVFRTRTAPSRCLVAVDVHMIPHIERAGHPRALPRRTLVRRALDRLAAFVHTYRRGCGLLIGGDWNVDGYADRRVRSPVFPYAHLAPLGLRSSWAVFHARDTLGSRSVDGFYLAGIRPLALRVLVGTYSDHNGVRLRFRW